MVGNIQRKTDNEWSVMTCWAHILFKCHVRSYFRPHDVIITLPTKKT